MSTDAETAVVEVVPCACGGCIECVDMDISISDDMAIEESIVGFSSMVDVGITFALVALLLMLAVGVEMTVTMTAVNVGEMSVELVATTTDETNSVDGQLAYSGSIGVTGQMR